MYVCHGVRVATMSLLCPILFSVGWWGFLAALWRQQGLHVLHCLHLHPGRLVLVRPAKRTAEQPNNEQMHQGGNSFYLHSVLLVTRNCSENLDN